MKTFTVILLTAISLFAFAGCEEVIFDGMTKYECEAQDDSKVSQSPNNYETPSGDALKRLRLDGGTYAVFQDDLQVDTYERIKDGTYLTVVVSVMTIKVVHEDKSVLTRNGAINLRQIDGLGNDVKWQGEITVYLITDFYADPC